MVEMKTLSLLLASAALLGCKSEKTDDVFFYDESMSSFIISSKTEEIKIVNVNYELVFIIPDGRKELGHYLAKYTTTEKICMGCDWVERNIKVEIYSIKKPSKLVMKMDKDCDKLDLFADKYKTTVYDYCGSEDRYEIFDYKQKSIIQADNKIVSGEIPNSEIMFYVGFEKECQDTLSLGSLNYSYNSDEKYTIKIQTQKNLTYDSHPDIEILSDDKNDKFSESNNRYTFWSLNKIGDKNSINNLVIKLTFSCQNESTDNVIEIQIKNGKPFGREEATQEIYVAEFCASQHEISSANKKLVDSLKFVKEVPYIHNCTDTIFWKIVGKGKDIIPPLLDKMTDTTILIDSVYVPNFGGLYTVADVAHYAINIIVKDIPTFELIGISESDDCGSCSYWHYVRGSMENRKKLQKALRRWYEKNEKDLVWMERDMRYVADCDKQPVRGVYEARK